ncbi:MAG: 4-(cytidine 5'-diphospho)-2-C-methyl-D-erythritol kinase [Chloroflexota bacterium]
MTSLSAEAHAKVNLALAVTGRRDDGYHLLRSVFLRLALHDRLTVAPAGPGTGDSLVIDGALAPSHDNLVLRAAAQLRTAIDPSLPALRFRLHKRIPAAAGLGGGSSDAAAAIDLALAAWGARLHPAARLEVALRLGADVPFFVAGHAAALVEGIGEHVLSLPAPDPPAGLVLLTPARRLSTAEVFAEYDRRPGRTVAAVSSVDEVTTLLRERIDPATLAATASMLGEANDLWVPATRVWPGLAAVREAATGVLGRALLLTGSGPTLVAVYPSEAAATRAAVALQTAAPPALEGAEILTTSTITRGEDP